jgi:death-on-curing family protein
MAGFVVQRQSRKGEQVPRSVTLRQLATEAGLDFDEALVTAWDEGFDSLEDIDDVVPRRCLAAIRRVFGLANPKELQKLSYWEDKWGLDRESLAEKLASEFDISVGPEARVLPKGALSRLRRNGFARLPRQDSAATPDATTAASAQQPLVWDPPGHHRDVTPLSVEEICQVHQALVHDFAISGDPIDPPGVREDHLLHSAAARPETSLGGIRKYDTVEVHAAALLHSLVLNHPFHNGNKRTGLVSMLVLLDRNNMLLTCNEKELFRLVLRVAQHRVARAGAGQRADREVLAIADWICQNSRGIQKGERILKWKDLRRCLTQLGCTISAPVPGNKVKIERVVTERVLGIKRNRTLRYTAGYRNEGSEVDANYLNAVRRALRLDEQNGYDSDYFYGMDPREPDEFIAEYRTLLRRLGRL